MNHHPSDDMLFDYVVGAPTTGANLLVATHLTYCPECRRTVRAGEAIGGSLMAGQEDTAAPSPQCRDAVLTGLSSANHPEIPDEKERGHSTSLPAPLRTAIGWPLDAVPWSPVFPGVWEYRLDQGGGKEGCYRDASLLRIRAGRSIPRHTHEGRELTLVLAGGFSDAYGRYGVGDVSCADGTVDHKPMAEPQEDCVCLVVVDAPARLTGRLGRILNMFTFE